MNILIYRVLYSLLLVIFILHHDVLFASPQREKINILTWWGYLDYPQIITAAESKCHVQISFDEYYSNDEFLRRWEGQNDYYDVIIFSSTIYNGIKKKIPIITDSTLSGQSKLYHPIIKIRYAEEKYPPNIVYLLHALTGFLWNPDKISLSSNDSITSIFKKAKNNHVAIIDDPVDASRLIKVSMDENHERILAKNILTIDHFRHLTQSSHIFITNSSSKIYKNDEFAFSFGWSGVAIEDMVKSKKEYKFLLHPKLSYISSDLLAQTSHKRGALCVASFLANKNTTSFLQNHNYYFSPYADYSAVKNAIHKKLYKEFVESLPRLAWVNLINENDFQEINQSWRLIKISLHNNIGDS